MDYENSDNGRNDSFEKRRFYISLWFPVFFLLLIWCVWFIETTLGLEFATWGLFPRKMSGLRGILFAPLIHAGLRHLIDNSIPLFTLSVALFYFYRNLAFRIFFLTYLLAGIWVWLMGRESYHIGASGLIYGLAAFLFVSGIIRNHVPLMALSLVVVFLYGSLVWGIFPLKVDVSWESHLLGSVAGVILAVHYRRSGPRRKNYVWEDEEEEEKENL